PIGELELDERLARAEVRAPEHTERGAVRDAGRVERLVAPGAVDLAGGAARAQLADLEALRRALLDEPRLAAAMDDLRAPLALAVHLEPGRAALVRHIERDVKRRPVAHDRERLEPRDVVERDVARAVLDRE